MSSYFKTASPNIVDNEFLREPQIEAYERLREHFIERDSKEHALIILPTGTGKTGLMGIAPYDISNGRVLIITPQTVIRDSVLGSLDPLYPKNFWLFTRVFDSYSELPTVIEYEKSLTDEVIHSSDIVILNIHKLQERLDSSLIKRVKPDFFDFIIIDEAHHSEATTWKRALTYFNNAKVLKVTGTPFRSDGKIIEGKEVYTYGLGKAMAKGYVKSLEKIDYIPGKVYLTLDKNSDELYTIDQIREMGLKDEDWIRRSVALSTESNLSIIDQSIIFLSEKKEKTSNPHKIIAVACSIWHAEQLKELYEAKGYSSSIVHSELEKHERELEFAKINSNKVDVVINVAMLGEGYDHKFLSIAALFRPYKTLLPYAQFIGRVLRSISEDDVNGNLSEEDNIAVAIHHKELGLDELWDYYKKEIKKRDIIKRIRTDYPIEPTDRFSKDVSFGSVSESEDYTTVKDAFIESELLKVRKQKIEEEQEKIKNLQALLEVTEEKARILYQQSLKSQDKERYLRPDLYLKKKKAEIDQLVREDVIPQLLVDFNLELQGNELPAGRYILPKKYQFIYGRAKDNGSLLGQYFNLSLKHHIGEGRDGWKIDDYDRAIAHVQELEAHLRNVLENR
ncbi:DEAD/DEAH box helicase [Bacillus sp. IBL03825]|uniref:DEAD/DEAH box helicase n=1 Tax=Bacillus sp. IBL03825 TaxID=2953580 RepID=UPI002158253E|nr:DEAD/DEAH box helicase family protein [Bacillus sp. IBL03825]MCR6850323.1 DEAD/DEAH box helicase family protein [Bacillus sp. IBL03825]